MKPQLLLLPLIWLLLGCELPFARPNEPFFCKINGKAFRPEKDTTPFGGVGSPPIRATFNKQIGSLFINARNSPNSMTLRLRIEPNESIKVGEYKLFNDLTKSRGYYTLNYSELDSEDIISESGNISITKVGSNLISGTFEFEAVSKKSMKVYKITKGEFNDLFYP